MKTQHTQGEWKVKTTLESSHKTIFVYSEIHGAICQIPNRFGLKEHEANARLIADAGTTASKCGLLPSELLEQRNELLEALRYSARMLKGQSVDIEYINQAIKKATQP